MIGISILACALVLCALVGGLAHVIASKKSAGPTRELAACISLLERVVAYDAAVTSMAQEHRDEAKRLIASYKKELTA